MSMTHQQLKRAAVEAHDNGIAWSEFWRHHGPHVVALEPFDRQRFCKLTRRLSMLLVCGDTDGQLPIENAWPRPEPREIDDMEALDRGQ